MGWKPSAAVRCRRSRRRELLLREALRRASDGADLLLLRDAEGRAAAARGDDVGVVDLEAGTLERVDVVDRRAVDVGQARAVDEELQAVALEDHVTVAVLVERELVLEARAASTPHADAQAGRRRSIALAGEKLLDLLGALVAERDSLGFVGDFLCHRFTKYSESLPCPPDARFRRTQAPDRDRAPRCAGRRREPRQRALHRARGQRPFLGPEPDRPAQARLRDLRRRARRRHPRVVPQDGDPMSEPETTNPIRDAIADAIRENRVILFMKGTPEQPMCGFSARTSAAIQALDAPFAAVDILPDPRIRQELSALSNWPTIPQLFVDGELVGGADIVAEMYESGELAQVLKVEMPDAAPEAAPAGADPAPAPLSVENRLGS